MMKGKKNVEEILKLTPEKLYHLLAIFFFSTLVFIISVFLFSFLGTIQIVKTISLSLFIFSSWGFAYLLGDFIGYYLTRTFNFLKEKYEKYGYIYWGTFGLILLIIFGLVGYKYLGKIKFIEVTISVVLNLILVFIVICFRKFFEKKFKPVKS